MPDGWRQSARSSITNYGLLFADIPQNQWLSGERRFESLTLAFLLECLMVANFPADHVGAWLGGASWWAIPASVAVGVPAYPNGGGAIPTVSALIDLGLAPGAALAFLVAVGVTSIAGNLRELLRDKEQIKAVVGTGFEPVAIP